VYGTRFLSRAGLLIGCLLAGSANADEVIRFVSPQPDDLIFGSTVFQLEIAEIDPPIDRVDVYVDGVLIGTAVGPTWSLTWDAGSEAKQSKLLAIAFSGERMIARARLSSSEAPYNQYERVDLVQLYPVVRKGEQYVRDLARGDFQIYENDEPVELEHFATEVASLSLVLILDVSGSMAGKLGQLQVAASSFVDDMRETDQVALYAFDHATRMLADLTVDHERVKQQIWELSPGGGTALYDSVVRVIGENLRYVPGRKAMFVFSDGQDRHSFTSIDRAARMAADQSVLIYTVGSGEDEASIAARDDLRLLAEQTGGKAYFIRRARQMEGTFDAILADLRAQYVLSYRPADGPGGIRKIRVEAAKPGGGSYNVRCRKSYYYRPPDTE
jgi:Ca-activated chloride channel family protein